MLTNAEAADAETFRHFSTLRNREEAVHVLTCTHKWHYTPQHHKCWKIKVYSCIWKESLCSDFLNVFSVCGFRLISAWLLSKWSYFNTQQEKRWSLSAAGEFDSHHHRQNQASRAAAACSGDSLPDGGSIALWSMRRLRGERSQARAAQSWW